jgi:hypothetical protein
MTLLSAQANINLLRIGNWNMCAPHPAGAKHNKAKHSPKPIHDALMPLMP